MAEAEDSCRQGLAVREKLCNDYPADPEYCEHWLQSLGSMAFLTQKANRLSEALDWRTKELEALHRLPTMLAKSRSAQRELSLTHQYRAELLELLHRYDEATIDWTKAAESATESRKALMLSRRAISRIRSGAANEGLDEMELLIPKADSFVLYNAGCAYAVAAESKNAEAAKYPDRAMELLRQAFEKGWANADHAKKDDDLTVLRERLDFQKLLADMAAAQAAKKQPPEQSKK
jgi:tetratricopeptide (TPR) repeat protein